MLFASKIPGVFMAGFLCAQTAMSVLTPPGAERVAALGRLTASYTVGGVVGPYLGGWLGAQGDYFVAARYACAGSLVAAALVPFLPGDARGHYAAAPDPKEGKGEAAPGGDEEERSWGARVRLILRLVGVLFFVKIASGVANSMARAAQPLILKNELQFTEADMGKFLSANFAFGGFANGVLLGPLTKLLGGEVRVVVHKCLLIMAAFYALQAAGYSSASPLMAVAGAGKQYPFIAASMGVAMFQFSLGTGITAQTTQTVPEHMKGTLMGMEHALFSLARIGGPAAGVYLLKTQGISGLSAVIAAVFFGLFALVQLCVPKDGDGARKDAHARQHSPKQE